MDEAFVEDAENQVNHEDGHDQQNAESAERFLEGLRAALEAGDDRNRQRRIGQRLHLVHRLADRDPAGQIKRECHRRKLARMVDRERAEALGEARDGAQRDELARGRADIEFREHGGIALIAVLHLEDDVVFVVGRVDGRGLALAVGAVKSVFHGLWRDTQSRGLVAVHNDVGLGIPDLQIGGDVREARQLRHPGGEGLRIFVEILRLRTYQGELVLALGHLAADADRRRVLKKDAQAGDAC